MHLDYLFTVVAFLGYAASSLAEPTPKPNVLLIVSDDQRYDDFLEFMPNVRTRLVAQGQSFEQAFVTTASCCPSRASILTGQYASRHQVRGNDYQLQAPTIVQSFHQSGYYTGLIGKYLNSWNGEPRQEFDFWVGHAGGQAEYENPLFNVQGKWQRETGYVTQRMREHALEFFRASQAHKQPFFLLFTPPSPHRPAIPAPEDRRLYSDRVAPLFANLMRIDPSGKPQWIQQALTQVLAEQKDRNLFYRNQLRTLVGLDREIGTLLDELHSSKQLDQTIVVYLSDNGLLRGEFGLRGKDCAYEAAVHVPMVWFYPPRIPQNRNDQTHLVANIDIAPTLAELCGLSLPGTIDGRSLAPLFAANARTQDWRKSLLLEGWSTKGGHVPFVSLRTETHKLIRTRDDMDELYDLRSDPLEIVNLAADPKFAGLRGSLVTELNQILTSVRGGVSYDLPQGTKADPTTLRFSADDPE